MTALRQPEEELVPGNKIYSLSEDLARQPGFAADSGPQSIVTDRKAH